MKQVFFISILLGHYAVSFCQGGKLTGSVTDAATNTPLELATVSIFGQDSSLITYQLSDKNGKFADLAFVKLNKLKIGEKGTITGVSEHSSPFLKHLEKLGLTLGKKIQVTEITDFDGSVELLVNNNSLSISREVAKHILISK